MSDFESMRDASREAIEAFGGNAVLRAIHDGTWTLSDYQSLLLTLHFQVFQGTMSFALAAGNCSSRFHFVREFLVHHANEEMGHYTWIEDDLRSTGYTGVDPKQLHPSSAAAAYVAFNEYNARHMPVSRLASSTVLEGLAAHLSAEDAVRAINGLGLTADNFSFFLRHQETDKGHIQELWSVVSKLELDEHEWGWMSFAARTAGSYYRQMYDGSIVRGDAASQEHQGENALETV